MVRVGQELVAIPLEFTRGVASTVKVTPLPGSLDEVRGLVFLHGGIEALIDLNIVRSRQPTHTTTTSRLVLVEAEGRRAVLLVDDAVEMVNANGEGIVSTLNPTGGTSEVLYWGGSNIEVVQVPQLLAVVEQHKDETNDTSVNNKTSTMESL